MKLKYAIIATIIFNLVLISIFLCRQYKEYHNRSKNYKRNRKYKFLFGHRSPNR